MQKMSFFMDSDCCCASISNTRNFLQCPLMWRNSGNFRIYLFIILVGAWKIFMCYFPCSNKCTLIIKKSAFMEIKMWEGFEAFLIMNYIFKIKLLINLFGPWHQNKRAFSTLLHSAKTSSITQKLIYESAAVTRYAKSLETHSELLRCGHRSRKVQFLAKRNPLWHQELNARALSAGWTHAQRHRLIYIECTGTMR